MIWYISYSKNYPSPVVYPIVFTTNFLANQCSL